MYWQCFIEFFIFSKIIIQIFSSQLQWGTEPLWTMSTIFVVYSPLTHRYETVPSLRGNPALAITKNLTRKSLLLQSTTTIFIVVDASNLFWTKKKDRDGNFLTSMMSYYLSFFVLGQKLRNTSCQCFFKWAIPVFFFVYFRSLQTNKHYNFTANHCEKCPSSILFRDLNPQPLEHESFPITTRPRLPPVFK